MKHFIITVDTEGDNLWDFHGNGPIGTRNTQSLPRFQKLCKKYGFKPVYLTNYEMIMDDEYVNFAKETQQKGECEVGLHVHAWNNPPLYELPIDKTGQAYLIEYPEDIMREKVLHTFNLIKEKIGVAPVTHRAGRWAMDDRYFKILKEIGIKVDCSHTPHINWKESIGANIGGCDYRNVLIYPSEIEGILEVPMSVRKGELIRISRREQFKMILKRQPLPRKIIWLRPAAASLDDMKKIIDIVSKDKHIDYAEFMIHSSELMAGGSPYFKDEQSIESLYSTMDQLFTYAKQKGFVGRTLKEYYEQKN